jgi:hypothetical protein
MKLKTDSHTADLKDILFDLLQKENVKTFTVSFDGSGDSGQIEDIALENKILDKPVEGIKIPAGMQYSAEDKVQLWDDAKTIRDIVDSVCYEVLENACGGWEINDGSYGEFTFDVNKRTAKLDFNERVMEVNSTNYEF